MALSLPRIVGRLPNIKPRTEARRASLSGAAIALTVVVGCAADPPPRAAESEAITFEVLYVGADATLDLAGRERLDALPVPLAQAPVDVLCLQGIATPEDRANLKTTLAKVFPFSLDLPTDDDTLVDDPRDATGVTPPAETTPPCSGGVAVFQNTFQSCLARLGCIRPDGSIAYVSCLQNERCLSDSQFAADPERRCRSCIVGHARTGATPAEVAPRCREKVHPLNLGGQHGMMILSKLPLSRPSLDVLPSEVTRRAIVGATVTTPRGTELDVFCASLGPTHASALPSDPRVSEPYPGPYGAPRDGWIGENALHIERLGAHVTATRGDRPAVVLGNFGVSAEVAHEGTVILPALGALGAARLEQLFVPGVAADYVPGCTVCTENPLVHDAPPSFDNRIYLAGLSRSMVRSSVRTYLGAVLGMDPMGARGRAPISMQYGFRSELAVPVR